MGICIVKNDCLCYDIYSIEITHLWKEIFAVEAYLYSQFDTTQKDGIAIIKQIKFKIRISRLFFDLFTLHDSFITILFVM